MTLTSGAPDGSPNAHPLESSVTRNRLLALALAAPLSVVAFSPLVAHAAAPTCAGRTVTLVVTSAGPRTVPGRRAPTSCWSRSRAGPSAGLGGDVVCGSGGPDALDGGSGNDLLLGGGRNDSSPAAPATTLSAVAERPRDAVRATTS